MAEFRMPSLGADMTEGTVTRWLVAPGDSVRRGDIVVEIETDKADMEVEVFESGQVSQIVVPQGETVPVGAVLAIIAPAAAAVAPAPPVPAAPAPAQAAPAAHAVRATPTAQVRASQLGIDLSRLEGTGVAGAVTRADVEHAAHQRAPTAAERPAESRRLLVSPRARRVAAERGIDLATVLGTGPDGSITAADVERAAAAGAAAPVEPPTPAPETPRPRQRGQLANLMEKSNREIPHYYLGMEIPMEKALRWLAAENKRRPVTDRLLYAALLLRATALAAREVPEMNGYFLDGAFQPSEAVNVGVAVSLRGGGLVAPAILDGANKSLVQTMQALQDLVKRARGGRLRPSEMTAGTITVTNLGELGVDYVQGVIYPPQVALVGFGRIRERPWAEDGMLGVKPVISATLAADHRASDGHRGGVFLNTLHRLLQEPEHL